MRSLGVDAAGLTKNRSLLPPTACTKSEAAAKEGSNNWDQGGVQTKLNDPGLRRQSSPHEGAAWLFLGRASFFDSPVVGSPFCMHVMYGMYAISYSEGSSKWRNFLFVARRVGELFSIAAE